MSDICCRQKPRAAALARIETPHKSSLIALCISEMITSLRKLLFAVLGLSLILTLTTQLTHRFGFREILNQTLTLGFQRFHSELANPNAFNPRPEQSSFNSTLLSLASIELGDAVQRQQIAALLETAAYGGRSYRRVTEHDEDASRRRRRPHLTAMQLFHPKFAPFWSEFRRTLRSWSFNKKYAPRVMNELVESVKNPLDKHYFASGMVKNGGRRYGSCAVVGNSGILLSRSHGALIDSHDMVIRLNNARTAGFSDSVGAKTTLAFVNSHILHFCSRRTGCFCHPYGEDVPIIMYICQVTHFMDYAFCNASHKAPLLVTDARFDNLCARIVKYYSLKNFVETTGKHPLEWGSGHEGSLFHYSSGMQAVMLALGICDQVSLFGFGKSPDAKHHYHTNQKAELKLHDYEAEYRFYNDLVSRTPYIPFLGESGMDIPPVKIYV